MVSLLGQDVDVNVVTHYNQRYAVWFGGSVLASMESFQSACHSKADYEEHGPR
jgi:actin-related protein 3